jgi:ABC-2 type transport system permease protein
MRSIAIRIIRQVLNDKRSLALIVVAPIFLMTLLYLLLGKAAYTPIVATDGLPNMMLDVLKEQEGIEVVEKKGGIGAADFIKEGSADAVVTRDSDGIHILMLEPDAVKMRAVTDALKAAAAQFNPLGSVNLSFLYGDPDESTFDSIGYLLTGILSFFMIFIFSGISFVRERTQGTVERLMATPVRTAHVVLGYIGGFGVFALLQAALLIVFAKFVFKMPFAGQWWLAGLVMLLIAFTAVLLGLLVSAVSRTEFQVMQFIPIVIIPQFFFTGLIPVDTLPYHLSLLSRIMPLYYGSMALRGVMVYGSGFAGIASHVLALIAYVAALFVLNVLAVKRYRAA